MIAQALSRWQQLCSSPGTTWLVVTFLAFFVLALLYAAQQWWNS